jgi:hypothetical protein
MNLMNLLRISRKRIALLWAVATKKFVTLNISIQRCILFFDSRMFQLYHFPRRFRYVIGAGILILWTVAYWYTNLEDFSTAWSYSLQWTYSVQYDSELLSWQILWSFSWWTDLLWNTLVTLYGSWNYWTDSVSFGPHKRIDYEDSSYLYYGPVEYIASQQTWLSQIIHQYFRLWDSYEKKWYHYAKSAHSSLSLQMFTQTLERHWFTTTHSKESRKFSRKWEILFTKSLVKSWNIQTVYGEISYILEPTTLFIKKPQQYLEGDIFTEAFLWSGNFAIH